MLLRHVRQQLRYFLNRADETRFSGEVKAQDIADVLPLWGYVPTVDAKEVSVLADVRWFGNPLEIQLLDLIGSAKKQEREARFVDIECGPLVAGPGPGGSPRPGCL